MVRAVIALIGELELLNFRNLLLSYRHQGVNIFSLCATAASLIKIGPEKLSLNQRILILCIPALVQL
jgi:hypothetical protein